MTWGYSGVTPGSLGVTLESLGVTLGVGENSRKSPRQCKVRYEESFNKSLRDRQIQAKDIGPDQKSGQKVNPG